VVALKPCPAQTGSIEGRVIDDTGASIPFVNIGVRTTSVGCISDERGTFRLEIPDRLLMDSIVFSAIGHSSMTLAARDAVLQGHLEVVLPKKIYELPIIEIHGQQQRIVELGTHKGIAPGSTSIQSVHGGAAMALLIRPPEGPFRVVKANVTILESELDTFLLRFRFLGVDPVSGKPGKDLVHREMIVRSSINKGEVVIDLSAMNINLDQPFFLAIEWINDERTAELLRRRLARNNPRIDGEIRNNKVVRTSADGRVIEKRRLTDAELERMEQDRVPRVYLRTRAGGRYTCMSRDASFADWESTSDVLVANVTIAY